MASRSLESLYDCSTLLYLMTDKSLNLIPCFVQCLWMHLETNNIKWNIQPYKFIHFKKVGEVGFPYGVVSLIYGPNTRISYLSTFQSIVKNEFRCRGTETKGIPNLKWIFRSCWHSLNSHPIVFYTSFYVIAIWNHQRLLNWNMVWKTK